MKRISVSKTDGAIIKFIIKVVISTISSILLFSYISAHIIYKLDLSLDSVRICAIIICAICSGIISCVSVTGLKNNGSLMGILSEIPLIFYSLINTIFNNDNYLLFIIKLVLIILLGALIGFIRVNRNKKFKVK